MRRHGGGRPGREGAMDVRTVLLLALAALLLVNATTAFTGLHLGVNLFNGLVVGVLGIPGLVLLLLVQWVVT